MVLNISEERWYPSLGESVLGNLSFPKECVDSGVVEALEVGEGGISAHGEGVNLMVSPGQRGHLVARRRSVGSLIALARLCIMWPLQS